MSRLTMQCNGLEFSGWINARITRGVDAIAGGFELSINDKWDPREQPWPLKQGDEATISVNETVLITGWIDTREHDLTADGRSFRVSGRDKAGALVDCSAVLTSSQFRDLDILGIATKLCDPFGINVTLDPSVTARTIHLTTKKNDRGSITGAGSSGKRAGLATPKAPKKFTINPGESAFAVLDRACRLAAVVPVSDGQGNIVLTRTGSGRASTDLVEGRNVVACHARYNSSGRYHRYIVRGQSAGTDEWFGTAAAAASGEAFDFTVSRRDRVLLVRPEQAVTAESAKSLAAWTMTTRAARSVEVSVIVSGWTQSGPTSRLATGPFLPVWPVNALVNVQIPSCGLVDDQGRAIEMLITQAVHTVDEQSGEYTELTLKRPRAFTPEPTLNPEPTGRQWDEIAHGVR